LFYLQAGPERKTYHAEHGIDAVLVQVYETTVKPNDRPQQIVSFCSIPSLVLLKAFDLHVKGFFFEYLCSGKVEKLRSVLLALNLPFFSQRRPALLLPLSKEYDSICCCWDSVSLGVLVRVKRLQIV